jgi:SAM-dependent methyltransferase
LTGVLDARRWSRLLPTTRRRRSVRIAWGAAPFILLQRTQIQSEEVRRALLWLGLPYVPVGLQLEGWWRRRTVERAYVREIEADFLGIEQYLPPHAASIMDIGCGIAAVDALLFRYYSCHEPMMYLVDRSHISDEIYFGFRDQAAFYNSLALARRTLIINGVPEDRIRTIEAPPVRNLRVVASLDVVISLLAWGFHFPVSTYLDSVCSCLAADGRLILDVRRGTNGMKLLTTRFSNLSVISETAKAQRVCAQALRERS